MARRADHTAEELKEMIIKTSQNIIADKGLSGLTTRAIAKNIGYTPGTLYQYFRDINDIILSVHALSLQGLICAMKEAPKINDPQQMLHIYADVYLDFIAENQKFWDALFEYHHPKERDIPQWYATYVSTLEGFITVCFEDIEPKDTSVTPLQGAQLLWASIHGVSSFHSTGRLGLMMEDNLHALIHRLVDLHIKAYKCS